MIERVRDFIEGCIGGQDRPGRFEELALEVFAHQFERVPLYRRVCEGRRLRPGKVSHWMEVPAIPADAFKDELAPEDDAVRIFLSSGTTQGAERRSRHAVGAASLELYRRSSMAHFSAMVMPDRPGEMDVLILGPTVLTHPQSSLGHMFEWAAGEHGGAEAPMMALRGDGHLDVEGAVQWLERAAAGTRPVLILALTSAITAVFEALRARRLELRLPADSRLVDTGGRKGGRALSRNGILKAAWRFLHIPAYLCTSEYGMTELLSQLYDDALRSRWSGLLTPRAKMAPAWCRAQVVDPATLLPVAPGERGLLRYFDLANVESVSAIQTLDVGFEVGNGIEVAGRASAAESRGCSALVSVLQAGSTT
ncbi:MAG TPA: hypothetical protein VEC57_03390 [Candidatus Limnocylindrales bacterium]|nr:hypothetical protein [Candidatus Limnocylindrales bacterium]